MSTSTVSATELLRQRHVQIKTMFEQTLHADGDARGEMFDCLRATLAAHETVEEMFVHPLARTAGDEANGVVDARLEEEKKAQHTLSDLEKLGVDGDQFGPKLMLFMNDVVAHAEAEETELFPILERNCNQRDLEALADSIIVSEELAPTHAHPHAPQNPIALMLTGPFVAMVDKARDALSRMHDD